MFSVKTTFYRSVHNGSFFDAGFGGEESERKSGMIFLYGVARALVRRKRKSGMNCLYGVVQVLVERKEIRSEFFVRCCTGFSGVCSFSIFTLPICSSDVATPLHALSHGLVHPLKDLGYLTKNIVD